MRSQHFDHIEAEGDVRHIKETEPMHGTLADELLLLSINSIQRPAHLFRAAGLHLGKDKGLLIPADDIDLPTHGSAEVPAQNFPTQTLQVPCRLILSPFA